MVNDPNRWQTRPMSTVTRTARERARAEITQEIKAEARRRLAAEGAQKLSLRQVARELGMVSSAIYRYFPSRDELLTALIIDAYEAIGAHAAAAVDAVPADDPRGRWLALWHAVRAWALEHPHEYALVYGTPVPGYRAPQDTVEPASRIPLLMLGIAAGGRAPLAPPPGELTAQADAVAAEVAPGTPPGVVVGVVSAWTRLFGLLSFELFGHLKGSMDPAGAFFTYTAGQTANELGLGG
jgi:AcrR family transcriptional regulator